MATTKHICPIREIDNTYLADSESSRKKLLPQSVDFVDESSFRIKRFQLTMNLPPWERRLKGTEKLLPTSLSSIKAILVFHAGDSVNITFVVSTKTRVTTVEAIARACHRMTTIEAIARTCHRKLSLSDKIFGNAERNFRVKTDTAQNCRKLIVTRIRKGNRF